MANMERPTRVLLLGRQCGKVLKQHAMYEDVAPAYPLEEDQIHAVLEEPGEVPR